MTRSTQPDIMTELPGPNARYWIEKDEQYISRSYTRSYPSVIERGEGVTVWDVDVSFQRWYRGLLHRPLSSRCGGGHSEAGWEIDPYVGHLLLLPGADRTGGVAGGDSARDHDKRVLFSNSGTESIECAFKLARYATRRDKVIAFHGGFHGRTFGALSLTDSKPIQKKGFGPLIPAALKKACLSLTVAPAPSASCPH